MDRKDRIRQKGREELAPPKWQAGSVYGLVFCAMQTLQTLHKGIDVRDGNWTTRGYANSRIANSRTGQVADWTTRGLADAAKKEN